MNVFRTIVLFVSGSVLLCATGYARFQTWRMKTELQGVAKCCCLAIRASQVVPVYPLNEDLQPRDVFLVQTPIPKQVSEYTRRGFPSFDLHVHWLASLDYPDFYTDPYCKGVYGKSIPHDRPKPGNLDLDIPQNRLVDDADNWRGWMVSYKS